MMSGNQSVSQIEKRLGIDFPDGIREFMNRTHQQEAEGKWHCFDIPFNIVCGDMETAVKIYESVKDRSDLCQEALQFSIQG